LNSPKFCSDSIISSIKLWPQTNLQIALKDSIQCFKQNKFIVSDNSTIPSGNYNTQWNLGDGNLKIGKTISHSYLNKGNYTLNLISVSNKFCKDTIAQSIKVLESPIASFAINDTVQCLKGNSFVLNDKTNSNISYSRKWFHPTLSANQGNSEVFSSTDTGFNQVSLLISNNLSCHDTMTKVVYVAPMPEFEVSGPKELCKFDSITFTIKGNTINTYDWKVNNTNKGRGQSVLFVGQNTGGNDFEVTATSPFACVTNKLLNNLVWVNELPFVDFTDSLSYQDPFLLLTFKDKSNNSTLSRNWYFSNGYSGTNRIESFLISDTTQISAKLTIIDTNNCIAEKLKLIVYNVPYHIPNAFTPNQDGINDVFRIYGLYKFKSFSLTIYNRWGEIVFKSNEPKNGWNGQYMGETMPTGHYLYNIEIENQNGSKTHEKGTVILIR
jgi:gliding motility-associated-like protein